MPRDIGGVGVMMYVPRKVPHIEAFYFNGTLDGLDKPLDVRMMTDVGESRCSTCGSPMKYHARLGNGSVMCPCTYWIFNKNQMQIMRKDEFEGMYRKMDVEEAVWHS